MSIKKYLQSLSREELVEQVMELHKKYDDVKTYYKYMINPADKTVAEKYKRVIRNEFFPSRGGYGDPKLRVARKAVNDFKKLSPLSESLVDVMLHYVESGVEFTNAYGDINEPFYNSVASMFYDVCKHIRENNLTPVFEKRCWKIVADTDGIGWGFHDELADYYSEFIGE
ncbi:MAG TPA: DUF6155 family protein [Bacteroidia bacterium]|nr:DUF6155 family protein [Bacteroidia bacterium]